MLLAVSLSAVNPRAGRSYQFALALLTFVVYYNMVNIGQSWISNGRIGFTGWMLTLHGGMFSLAMGWLWARNQNWSWRNLVSRQRAAKVIAS
jgi:lipopolysaccharide export system permease protein